MPEFAGLTIIHVTGSCPRQLPITTIEHPLNVDHDVERVYDDGEETFNMIQTGLIPEAHSDLVTDATYNYYGLRLATCGLDQRIKIWQLDESTGKWSAEDDWRAHDAPISKVSWAHPEFGTIIASASYDRTVKIWEQTIHVGSSSSEPSQQVNGGSGQPPQAAPSGSRWVERAVLTDARGTVRSVEFAPHHFGLKLAAISSDNFLRIYECLDQQPALSEWQTLYEIDIYSLPPPRKYTSSTASGSHSHSRTQTIALGTPTQTGQTFNNDSASLVTQALQQSTGSTGAQSSSGPGVAGVTPAGGKPVGSGFGNREADGGWCVSWCKDPYWGEVLAAGSGTSGIIKIVQLSPSHRPTSQLFLDPTPKGLLTGPAEPAGPNRAAPGDSADNVSGGPAGGAADSNSNTPPTYSVTTVSWAPSCGRSYHLVATGGRDGRVRIWKVRPGDELDRDEEDGGRGDEGEGQDSEDGKWTASIVADFDHHKSAIGRVEWNITGTVLSSAGNDGRIRLWKATSGGNVWRPAGSIGVEQVSSEGGDGEGAGREGGKDVEMEG